MAQMLSKIYTQNTQAVIILSILTFIYHILNNLVYNAIHFSVFSNGNYTLTL
jgi:hypothetical protein